VTAGSKGRHQMWTQPGNTSFGNLAPCGEPQRGRYRPWPAARPEPGL